MLMDMSLSCTGISFKGAYVLNLYHLALASPAHETGEADYCSCGWHSSAEWVEESSGIIHRSSWYELASFSSPLAGSHEGVLGGERR
jgi:hypothetical protein